MMNKFPLHVPLLLLWVVLSLWFEIALFRLSAVPCSFPRDESSAYEFRASYALIADPQLTDAGSYESGLASTWPLRYVVEWSSDSFMRRAYKHAVQSLSVDGELFLGDMFDTAAFGTDELFSRSFKRFVSIFPAASFRLFVPGNHDLGLLSAYSSERRLRYIRHFGASDFEFQPVGVPLRFVGVNAPAVASGFVSFCNKSSPAPDVECPKWMQGPRGFSDAHADSKLSMSVVSRSFLTKWALPYACSTSPHPLASPHTSGLLLPPDSAMCPLPVCRAPAPQRVVGHAYGAESACAAAPATHPPPLQPHADPHEQSSHIPILLSHLPLHRQPSSCGSYPDSVPIAPNFRLFSLRPWSVYSSAMPVQASARLLREVRPLLVLSGDHHRWCKAVHSVTPTLDAVEVTVGTFSWLQGSTKPSFGALLFTNSSESAWRSSLRPGCVASGSSQGHVVVCPCWLPDNRVSLAAYAAAAVGSLLWLLLRGSPQHALATWAVTCAAAVSFHVLLL